MFPLLYEYFVGLFQSFSFPYAEIFTMKLNSSNFTTGALVFFPQICRILSEYFGEQEVLIAPGRMCITMWELCV